MDLTLDAKAISEMLASGSGDGGGGGGGGGGPGGSRGQSKARRKGKKDRQAGERAGMRPPAPLLGGSSGGRNGVTGRFAVRDPSRVSMAQLHTVKSSVALPDLFETESLSASYSSSAPSNLALAFSGDLAALANSASLDAFSVSASFSRQVLFSRGVG